MLEELKQKNLYWNFVFEVCFPPTCPPNLCHVIPKGFIANQEYMHRVYKKSRPFQIQISDHVLYYLTTLP